MADHDEGSATAFDREASTLDAGDADVAGDELPVVERERYRIGDEISRGGIGRVLEGHDRHLDRIVAIKQLLAHNPRFEARFRREARITARLQHPGIVPIYEVGRWPTGEVFYAMKLVSGRSLKDELAKTDSLDDRLALIPRVLAVCDAMAYAHSQRVIHRDLKPANIMLGSFGEAYVVDWGLAKHLDAPEEPELSISMAGDSGLTSAGSILGTPPYLPPEQARGDAVDARADVYALGAALYHVLAGRVPYAGKADVIARVLDGPPEPVAALEPGVPRELVAIVDKAMARDAADRYRDAGELAADVRRFQTGQLVSAHHYSPRLLLARWVRRHRAIVIASAVAIAAIAVIGSISIERVVEERDAAQVARDQARAEADAKARRTSELYVMQAEHALETDPTAALAWLKRHAAGIAPDPMKIRSIGVDAASRGIARDLIRGFTASALADDGTVGGIGPDHRLALVRPGSPPVEISAPLHAPTPFALTPDGRWAAWCEPAVQLYDRTTGKHRELAPALDAPPTDLRFAGDELAIGERSGDIRLVAIATGAVRVLRGHKAPIRELFASPDGAWLVSTGGDASIRLWQRATGDGRDLPSSDHVQGVGFGGNRVAWAGGTQPVRWLELGTAEVHELPPRPGATIAVAVSPDGRRIATGGEDITVRVDDLGGGPQRAYTKSHTDWINSVAFSRDGKTVVSAQSRGGPLFAWDLATGDRRPLAGHTVTLNLARYVADGTLVTADRNLQIRWWSVPAARERLLLDNAGTYPELVALPGGGLISIRKDATVVWGDAVRAPRVLSDVHDLETSLVVAGDKAFAGDRAGAVWAWTIATGAAAVIDREDANELAVSRDGSHLAIGGRDGTIRLWTLGDHPAMTRLAGHVGEVVAVGFAPDGRTLASAAEDTSVRRWDVATGAMTLLSEGGTNVESLAYGPDGTLAIGRAAGMIQIWRPDGSKRSLVGHTAAVGKLAFVDAATLASAGNDGTARVWELATGHARVLPHRGSVQALVAIGDGRLATGNAVEEGGDATIRLWDLATASLLDEWHGHVRTVYALAVAADRTALYSAGVDGTVRAWPLDPPRPIPPATLHWLDTLSSVDLGDGDLPVTTPRR